MRIDAFADEPAHLWSLAEGVTVDVLPRRIVIATPWGRQELEDPSDTLLDALHRLLLGSVAARNVLAGPSGDCGTAPTVLRELVPLQHLIVRTLALGARPLLSVVPLSRRCRLATLRSPDAGTWRLAAEAVLSPFTGGLRVRSPASPFRADLHSPQTLPLLARLLWTPAGDESPLPASGSPLPVDLMLAYLVAAQLVVRAEPPVHGRA